MPRETAILIEALNEFVEQVVVGLSTNATANLIEDTPVDTGWARSNWVPTIGVSFEGTAGTRESAEQGSLNPGPQQSGLASIAASYRLQNGSVFVTNNVPYIVELNEGSSSQAPSGFVQMGIDRAILQVQNL